MTELVCDACKLPPHPPEAERNSETGLPSGWFVRRVGERSFTLCECCGDIRQFKGGVSVYLQEYLGLGPHAQLHLDDMPFGSRRRERAARR